MRQERNYFVRGLITLPQLRVLSCVAEEETGCAMRKIAEALGIGFSTVTGLVDRLVKIGLVRRITSPGDRRVVMAIVTQKGRRILDHIYRERRRMVITLFEGLSSRERAAYLEIIEKMVNKFSGVNNCRGSS